MRKLVTKVASLTLGVGALGFVMVNAALTHGCASSPATQVTPSNASAVDPSTDPDCKVPEYMYATKAPVWTMLPPKCRGEAPAKAPVPPQAQAPSPPVEPQRQAP